MLYHGYKWVGDPERGVGPKQPGGWAFQVAGFLEIDLATAGSANATESPEWLRVPFSQFRCPTRPAPELGLHTTRFAPQNAASLERVAKTDYAICEGDYITDTRGGPSSLEEGDSPSYQWTDVRQATGVSYQRSKVRPSDVLDGLSNTYLVGEKHVDRNHYHTGLDLGYDQSLFSGVDLDLARWVFNTPIGDWKSLGGTRRFGSAHSGGYYTSFCDGSVRMISYEIDRVTHARLGNRRDGQPVTVPE